MMQPGIFTITAEDYPVYTTASSITINPQKATHMQQRPQCDLVLKSEGSCDPVLVTERKR